MGSLGERGNRPDGQPIGLVFGIFDFLVLFVLFNFVKQENISKRITGFQLRVPAHAKTTEDPPY